MCALSLGYVARTVASLRFLVGLHFANRTKYIDLWRLRCAPVARRGSYHSG